MTLLDLAVIVIVGLSVLLSLMRGLVRELADLHSAKKQLVIVSSGAVAAGMTRLGRTERPKTIQENRPSPPLDKSN